MIDNKRKKEKKSARCCQLESRNDLEFIARNSAFYRPKIALIGQRVYGQLCIETLHESRKRNSSGLAYLNRITKCQNYRKISRN